MKDDLKRNPFYLKDEDIKWVESSIEKMTLDEKVGQLFCVLFKEAQQEEIEQIFSVLQPGGCMYRKIPMDLAIDFSNTIQEKSNIPLLIAANLEKGGNGIVNEGTLVGAPMQIAATDDVEMVMKMATVCALEGKAVGANWAFAPIIDIDYNFRNPITNTRTFGSNPLLVKEMGAAYVETVQGLGMASSIKHFPGDGRDERDQHLVTSINDCTVEVWDATYGMVYKECIDKGALTVMAGHIMQPAYSKKINPQIKDDEILPGSLSKELLQGLLRKQLGFNGLIVTDAATMAGFTIPMSRKDAVPFCIEAGCDMFLFSRNLEEDFEYIKAGIEKGIISESRLNEALTRILATKAALGIHKSNLYVSKEKAREVVGCRRHKEWAEECANKAITLVKEEKGVLPLTPEKYKRILIYPIESVGGVSQYATRPVCAAFADKLKKCGFEIEVFEVQNVSEGHVSRTDSMIDNIDAIIYLANLATKSNQTAVRIEWAQPMGANCPHYIQDIPTIFISVENPYHLLDVPRIKTFINTYSSHDECIDALIEKLVGDGEFLGKSPIDAFCGKWDTHL